MVSATFATRSAKSHDGETVEERLERWDTHLRAQVRGGGAKPYRQKGTGRARQGTRSAPHYAGGGVVFGPSPRSYDKRLPKRMRRLALVAASLAATDVASGNF